MRYVLGSTHRFDAGTARLSGGSSSITLRRMPGRVLEVLLRRPGALVRYEDLRGEVWGNEIRSRENLRQNLASIRRAFACVKLDPARLRTVRNEGVVLELGVRVDEDDPDDEDTPSRGASSTDPAERPFGTGHAGRSGSIRPDL